MIDFMKAFSRNPVISTGIFLFLFLSVFTQILLGFLYQNMIKEADNMATTDNKLLKQCKLKFANCYQLNHGVANIPIFVDKFLNRLAWGPFSFETLYHLAGQSMLVSVIFAGIGICKNIAKGLTLGEVLPFYIVSFLGLYMYFSISAVVDVKGRKRILKVNLVDYLENHLSARMGVTESDIEMLYGEAAGGSRRSRQTVPMETGGRKNRRTVEIMPFANRAPEVADMTPMAEQDDHAMEEQETKLDMSSDPSDSFRITDEELEALIKEFC